MGAERPRTVGHRPCASLGAHSRPVTAHCCPHWPPSDADRGQGSWARGSHLTRSVPCESGQATPRPPDPQLGAVSAPASHRGLRGRDGQAGVQSAGLAGAQNAGPQDRARHADLHSRRSDAKSGARGVAPRGASVPAAGRAQPAPAPASWGARAVSIGAGPPVVTTLAPHSLSGSPPLMTPHSSTRVAAQSPSPTLSSWEAAPPNCRPHLSLRGANTGAKALCSHLSVDLRRPGNRVAAFLRVRRADGPGTPPTALVRSLPRRLHTFPLSQHLPLPPSLRADDLASFSAEAARRALPRMPPPGLPTYRHLPDARGHTCY